MIFPIAAIALSLACPYTFFFSSVYAMSITCFNIFRHSVKHCPLLSLMNPTLFSANTPIP